MRISIPRQDIDARPIKPQACHARFTFRLGTWTSDGALKVISSWSICIHLISSSHAYVRRQCYGPLEVLPHGQPQHMSAAHVDTISDSNAARKAQQSQRQRKKAPASMIGFGTSIAWAPKRIGSNVKHNMSRQRRQDDRGKIRRRNSRHRRRAGPSLPTILPSEG